MYGSGKIKTTPLFTDFCLSIVFWLFCLLSHVKKSDNFFRFRNTDGTVSILLCDLQVHIHSATICIMYRSLTIQNQSWRGALGRAVEHSTSDHWVPGSKPGVFKSGALSCFVALPGSRSVAHKTLAVEK